MQALFSTVAPDKFVFLETAGYVGPLSSHSIGELVWRLEWVHALDAVTVLLDGREHRITTTIDRGTGNERLRVALDQLYVAAGLGPFQDVLVVATNERTLLRTLESQADALRAVLPRLDASDAAALFERARLT